jgi:hypothetical protein
MSRIEKSTRGSHPYNQGENLPSMEEDHGDRVQSGGLPTTIVQKYYPYLQSGKVIVKEYKVQGWRVTSREIRDKVKGVCHRHLVLFGLLLV